MQSKRKLWPIGIGATTSLARELPGAACLVVKSQSSLHQTTRQRGVRPHGIALKYETSAGIQHNTEQYEVLNRFTQTSRAAKPDQ